MNNGKSVISYALAALAGVCFIQGILLLSDEGGDLDYGTREEIHSNN